MHGPKLSPPSCSPVAARSAALACTPAQADRGHSKLAVAPSSPVPDPAGSPPAAVVGSPADPGTAAEEGSPAAAEGLAGMLPAVGHTGHYLQGGGNSRQCEQHVDNYT